jgi:hypothetical protein
MTTFFNDDNDDMTATAEHLIAYVFGATPPDFAAIAASGFDVVALDSTAPWFTSRTVAQAKTHGLTAVSFPMSYNPLRPTTYLDESKRREE